MVWRTSPAEAWPADMGSLTYTPRTVLAAGFSHLGAAPAGMVPKLRKNAKQPKPPKEPKMSTPKVQIPAKRAPKRAAPDENYSTQYVPPAQVAPAPSAIDLMFNDIKIDDNVPPPGHTMAATKQEVMNMLLGRLDVEQSACLDFGYKSTLLKAVQAAHKVTGKRFTVKRRHDGDNTIRVWRVA